MARYAVKLIVLVRTSCVELRVCLSVGQSERDFLIGEYPRLHWLFPAAKWLRKCNEPHMSRLNNANRKLSHATVPRYR